MIKQGEWYYIPNKATNFFESDRKVIGYLSKIIEVDKDNPNYVTIEEWFITEDRKFIANGVINGADSVMFTKFGKKVNAPPKAFEVLYSETVNKKCDNCQNCDCGDEYNEE